jgi:hypothetical protein
MSRKHIGKVSCYVNQDGNLLLIVGEDETTLTKEEVEELAEWLQEEVLGQ